MRRLVLAAALAAFLAASTPLASDAQILGRLRRAAEGALGGNAVEQITSVRDAPITTNLRDARWGDPTRDGFQPPTEARPLASLERAPGGGFVLQPGYYAWHGRSYCLHAGTHGPGGGDGYLYAPPLGQAERHVQLIAQRTVEHPEIPQRDVQQLLWAIVARAKVEDLTPRLKTVAAVLLTPQELLSLNRNALNLLPGPAMDALLSRMPAPVRRIAEAEARLRQMVTSATSTYDEMERTAVLAGVAPRGEGSQEIPSGRWSQHPDGFFVRYVPAGYTNTNVEVWVPEGSAAVGKTFDLAAQIAVPGNTARQRLLQSGVAYTN